MEQLQAQLKLMGNGGWYDNIAVVLFAGGAESSATDDDVLQAVEEKYDALNDKLLIEALINKVRT